NSSAEASLSRIALKTLIALTGVAAAMIARTTPSRSFGAWRRCRTRDGWQGLDVDGHCLAIFVAQLRRVAHDPEHRTPDPVIGRIAAGQLLLDVLYRPVSQRLLRDVRHPAFAFRIRSSGKALRLDDTTENIARAVALDTMTRPTDQIGAAIPFRTLRRI